MNLVYKMSGQADKILQAEHNREYNTNYPAAIIIPDSMATGAGLMGWQMLTESLHKYYS